MERIRSFILKLQSLPELQRRMIFFAVIIILAIMMFFWGLRSTNKKINELQVSLKAINPENSSSELPESQNSFLYEDSLIWQSYKNDIYKFEIKYPANFFVKENESLNESLSEELDLFVIFAHKNFINVGSEIVYSFLDIEIIKNDLPIKEWITNYVKKLKELNTDFEALGDIKEIEFKNKQAFQFSFGSNIQGKPVINHYTIFESDGKLFSIEYHQVLTGEELEYPGDIYQSFLNSFNFL